MATRDYSQGKFCMIEPICEHEEGEVYYGSIGSTIQKYLSTRFAGHVAQYKFWKNGKCHFTASFKLLEKYGIDNCKIVLVESFPCHTKYELEAREAYFIREKLCVNKVVPTRTKKNLQKIIVKRSKNMIKFIVKLI